MEKSEAELNALKARMTDKQRKDMADIVAAEVKRRDAMREVANSRYVKVPYNRSQVKNSTISGGLATEDLGAVYSEVNNKMKDRRIKQIDVDLESVRESRKVNSATSKVLSGARSKTVRNLLLMIVVAGLAVAKILTTTAATSFNQTASNPDLISADSSARAMLSAATDSEASPAVAQIVNSTRNVSWSEADKQVLSELDERRVELEKRKQLLDQREAEFKAQTQAMSERLAELRSLSTRIVTVRKERDSQYESRLEQLANVYGSMAPNEAAPLMARLDEDTALALLKRMPGKRMGQILSLMDQERAVQLTKILTDKTKLDESAAQ